MGERRPMLLKPLRRTVADARLFAIQAHVGQLDKAGDPYWRHLSRVSQRVVGYFSDDAWSSVEFDEAVQIAWLHDVIEDTEYRADDLLDEGFHRRIVDGVKLLSKPRGCLRYMDWIEHVAMLADLPTILVKIADVEDNSDPARLALLPAETRARLEKKYGAALPVLRAAAERLGWKG